MPQRTWLERASLAVECVLALVAVVTVVGWTFHLDTLLQLPLLGPGPLRMNAGLAVGFVAAGLLGIEFRARRLTLLGFAASAIGAASLFEAATGLNLHIDELLARDYLVEAGGEPGRISAVLAIALLAAGLVLGWHATTRWPRARYVTTAITGSVIASAGISTLVGFFAGLPAVSTWGTFSPMAPLAAICLTFTGLALVSLAWRENQAADGEAPAWSPAPVIIVCMTLTIVLWVGLGQRETAYIGANTVIATDRLVTNVQAEIDRQGNQFERMAARAANRGATTAVVWEAEARTQWPYAADKGCRLIAYLDAAGRTTWVFPRENNEGAPGFDHRSVVERGAALAEAARTGNPVVSASTTISTARTVERGFVIYAPIVRDNAVAGFIAAEFAYHPLFESIATREGITEQYHVSARIGGTRIYLSAPVEPTANESLTARRSYTIADRRVEVSLTPLGATIAHERRALPELALLAGFGITGLFGLSVHLARRARAGQRAAELSNRRLFAENEERRRVEARLKVSDERLRLALDSTQIGIFEWTVPARHIYYSPGLWAMLGYDASRMPSTVDSWQTLIHPDDLPGYRRRVEAQLSGGTSFIEPEYRVRARTGEWRWVYARSKSVTTTADGRPLRIVGTVQDISARRTAELALSVSQAEARKLSLVAAKTDNPVLITSPDGRIEWANEAFCRVMEYAADEVVGKNPVHLTSGPETNPDAGRAILSAFGRGEGISTDIVSYSKSGRKYYLHIEIQPVHSRTGTLQNFIAVATDITARVETEHQLRRAKAEADEASRAKSEFLASMSHEIRTPMNGVIGMTSLLMETDLTPEQRDFVNTIRTSGEALLTIINDILDFSKIESGKMEVERSGFDVTLCIEDALDLFALQAAAKKLELGYQLAPDVPAWILGDVTRLRQVLVNLLNNAVKFTPRGSISLEVRRAAPRPDRTTTPGTFLLEFTIRDTGIGIPADRVDRLFKAFSQVDSSTTRKYGGTGLGLAICERLTHLMGGEIRVESTPGRGSAFVFTIETAAAPNAPATEVPPLPRDATVLCVEDHPVTQMRLRSLLERGGVNCALAPDIGSAAALLKEMTAPPSALVLDADGADMTAMVDALPLSCPRLLLYPFGQTAPVLPPQPFAVAAVSKPIRTGAFLQTLSTLLQAPAPAAFALVSAGERPMAHEIPLEVLLAEDNPVNQKVALRFLERLGYRADAVANGLEALTAIENRRYDLVLMDLQMPEMDGFEATRQIRARLASDRQPKIVALTANAMQGDRDLCVAAGMDDYISKPVKMHEIAAAIRKHFGNGHDDAGVSAS